MRDCASFSHRTPFVFPLHQLILFLPSFLLALGTGVSVCLLAGCLPLVRCELPSSADHALLLVMRQTRFSDELPRALHVLATFHCHAPLFYASIRNLS